MSWIFTLVVVGGYSINHTHVELKSKDACLNYMSSQTRAVESFKNKMKRNWMSCCPKGGDKECVER